MFQIYGLTVRAEYKVTFNAGLQVFLEIPFESVVSDRPGLIERSNHWWDDAFKIEQRYSILSKKLVKPERLSSRLRSSGKSLNCTSLERRPDAAPRMAREWRSRRRNGEQKIKCGHRICAKHWKH